MHKACGVLNTQQLGKSKQSQFYVACEKSKVQPKIHIKWHSGYFLFWFNFQAAELNTLFDFQFAILLGH